MLQAGHILMMTQGSREAAQASEGPMQQSCIFVFVACLTIPSSN